MSGVDTAPLDNPRIAQALREMAALVEAQGGNPYRAGAYRRAAEPKELVRRDDGAMARPLRNAVDRPTAEALAFGDIDDPQSNVSRLVAENRHFRMHEELGTGPGFYYLWDHADAGDGGRAAGTDEFGGFCGMAGRPQSSPPSGPPTSTARPLAGKKPDRISLGS